MHKINVNEIKERVRQSPTGKFTSITKDISVALGSDEDSLDLSKRHAFELARVRLPKGKSYCPYHAHSAASELYLVISGCGSIRDKDGVTMVSAGDTFLFPPNAAHQLTNAGEEDFVYYVVADSPRGDSCFYPDSGKFAVFTEGNNSVIVKGKEATYFDGEE